MNTELPLEQFGSRERERLTALCTRLTGNPDAAEDLVQETLLEAWRHEEALRDPDRRIEWLCGIARNVCLRWRRKRARELAHIIRAPAHEAVQPVDPVDVEEELERDELQSLLEKALDLLPEESRRLLIRRYVDDLSTAEIAERQGVPPRTIAVRVHRSKQALRAVLSTTLREEAVAHDLPLADDGGFTETQMWCFLCGRHRMTGRLDAETDELRLRCDGCCPEPDTYITHSRLPGVFQGVERYRSALNRAAKYLYDYNWRALVQGSASCLGCGGDVHVNRVNPTDYPLLPRGEHGVYSVCSRCGGVNQSPLRYMVLGMPEVQSFWRAHPRMRLLPERDIDVGGRPALVLGAESVSNASRIVVVCTQDTFEVLSTCTSSTP